VRGPFDPAEPIAEIFQARGGGARGVNQSEVIQFNKEYGKAVTSFVHASPGGVTPKVTSNRAVTLAEPLRETENELGRFLQRQIDYKETVKTAERQRRVADGELRIAEAVKSLEDEKLAIAKSKKQSTEALRAGWAEQRGARKTQSASGRPPVRLVKFDALK
jgi:hypothetical protein